jgi:hypothetical protein
MAPGKQFVERLIDCDHGGYAFEFHFDEGDFMAATSFSYCSFVSVRRMFPFPARNLP